MGWTFTECFIAMCFVTVVLSLSTGYKRLLIPEVDTVAFVVLQFSTAILVGIAVWMSYGFVTVSDLTSEQYIKAFCIYAGGVVGFYVDFLLFAAIKHLNSFVVMGCFLLLSSPLGVILNYFVDAEDLDPGYLFGGTALAFVGLCFVLVSNYLLEEYRVYSKCMSSNDQESSSLLHDDDLEKDHKLQRESEMTGTLFWFLLLILTGVIGCLWSVLPAYGYSGTDAITDPSLVLLIYLIGTITSLPTSLILFGQLELLGPIVDFEGFGPLFTKICSYSWYQIGISVFIGLLYGVAFYCYFFSNVDSVLPTAASMAIYMSGVMITSLMCILVFGDYDNVHFCSKPIFYLALGMLFYCAAIFTVVDYAIQ